MIPAQAYAGWVVEGEPTVLVGYGERYVSDLGSQATHQGVDCLASAGAQCLFPAGGIVSFVGSVPAGDVHGCGTTMAVSVRIDDGRTLTLMPFDGVVVSEGQHVVEGQVAGTVASSGDGSTALSHVHVGLKRGRIYYDPSELLGAVPVALNGEKASGSVEEPIPMTTGENPPSKEELIAAKSLPAESKSSQEAGSWQEHSVEAAQPSHAASTEVVPAGKSSIAMRGKTPSQPVAMDQARARSISSGESDAAYEAWLVSTENSSERTSQLEAGLLEDIAALMRSTGLPPQGAALLLVSCLGTVALLAFAYCRKESNQVFENKMLDGRVYGDDCERKAGFRRRSSTFGGLTAARQGK